MTTDAEGTLQGGAPKPQAEGFRYPEWLALAALLIGLTVEILFYARPLGVSFPIWAVAVCLAALMIARAESRRPARDSAWLVIPILVLAGLAFVRLEPLTLFLNVVSVLCLFAVWVRAFRTGRVLDFGWLDFAVSLLWVPLEMVFRPWATLGQANRRVFGDRATHSRLMAVARGLLLALPIVVVLALLLTAADVIFADVLREAFEWLDLERLADLARRAVVILLCAILFLGALVAALRNPGERKLIGEDRPVALPFLGFTESAVVLVGVNLLFAAFVLVQVRYLFGGQANTTAAGYTYAEYARRGFGELVAVAILTLGLIMALGAFSHRTNSAQRTGFQVLSASLVVLVGVILASAFQRLLLYEQAYGFTRLRAYTHVAIVWIGVLFVLFLTLLITGNLRPFAPAAVGAAIGFALTLSILNVDDFIVRRNAERWRAGGELDIYYLTSLSEDAIPALAALAGDSPPSVQSELLPRLACQQAWLDRRDQEGWPATHLSVLRARAALRPWAQVLSGYAVDDEGPRYAWTVERGDGQALGCFYLAYD
ncbi:MAG: DUF4173 domain-containing protein [Chloroflexi bacterium]|nr:DUF4173 domain-containing protein [Chloroflexota bacterium]